MFAYCGNNPVNRLDKTGEAWYHWLLGAAVVAACAAAVVITAGGAVAGIAAIVSVANGVTAATAASTITAGAFLGSATAYGTAVLYAANNSHSVKDFENQGNWGTVAYTTAGATMGGVSGYTLEKSTPRRVSSGTSRPNKHSNPNSTYIQFDNSNRNKVRSLTRYNQHGDWYERIDLLHPHVIDNVPCCPHIHIAPPLNSRGLPVGRETVIPLLY